MTNRNNDIEELEELLTELEGQEAQIITPYSEEDDAVTRQMDAPLGDQDWMVQVTALDRRMMSNSQLLSELQAGKVNARTLVWRGGMDDWMPVSRIDELSRASVPAPVAPSAPRNSAPRAVFNNLAPPPPAPQRSQPLWANPPSAPLPPPPSAMSPPFGMAPGMGMPPPPMALAPPPPPPPMALTPPPPPPNPSYGLPMQMQSSASMPEPPMSQGNTTRPVAVDFSDMALENDPPLQSKRWVMALSAVAILAVFVTVYSLSSGGGEPESKAATAAATRPQSVSALQPSAAAPKEKPAASPPSSAPAPVAKAEAPAPAAAVAAKPSDEDESESDATESASARQTAQARYTPRSEYRRRSRGGASDEKGRSEAAEEEDEPAPAKPAAAVAAAAAAPPSSTARPAEEEEAPSDAVASVAEEVDEPAKGKSSNNTFNREAAKAALDEAASQAKNCRPQGGPSGTGRVQVRYEPSGKVANVAILTSKFDNTTAGSCVRMLFRRAKVPEFTGAPVMVVNKSFEIP